MEASLGVPTTLPKAPPERTQGLPTSLPASKTVNRRIVVDKPEDFIDLDVTSLANRSRVTTTSWSVQIGSFAQRFNAHRAAIVARRMADGVLGMTPANLFLVTGGEIPLWRVRFNDLNENQARAACAALFSARHPCIAVAVTKTTRG